MQYQFAQGEVFGRRVDGSNPTPMRFGALQGITLDLGFSLKALQGSKQFPIVVARGSGKITGKADLGQFNAQLFNDLFFNESAVATGQTITKPLESATITANVVTVTNNSTFVRDLGVVKASDGTPYVRVAATPVAQQYTVNESTGVYTFNSSQNSIAVKVSYQYTDAANGKTITITSKDQGDTPYFMVVLYNSFRSKKLTFTLNQCTSDKFGIAPKMEDFTIPSLGFEAMADDNDEVGKLSLAE